MSDRVLVTGAGGFIGRHVVRHLVERGYRVRATDLPRVDLTYQRELGAEVAAGDLLRYRFCREATGGVDSVVHIAAAFDLGLPREYLLSTNVMTTRNIARASAASGVGMFVQYSTCDVFGLKRRGPIAEDESKKPQCAYSLSKLLSEHAAIDVMRSYGMPVAVVRPTFVYGPGAVYTAGSFLVLPSLLSRYTDSVPLPSGGPRTSTVRVEDLAFATIAVMEAQESARGKAFNVADDTDFEAFELLSTVFEQFGIECERELKVPWKAIELSGRVAEFLPLGFFRAINRFLSKRWDRLLLRNDLLPLLMPRIDRDFIGFLYGEHLYRNERIKSLGWEPEYPTFADGWPETVRWYRERSLIP